MAASGALEGVRVLDLSRSVAGAVAAMLLGDFGADVLHAETQDRDVVEEPGYVCWDRNKSLVRVDTESAEGLAEIRRLVGLADVAIVDWPRHEIERLRLDASSTLATNPGLIHVWLPGLGATGRWSDLAPDPNVLAAVSGVADLYSASEDRPVLPVVPLLAYEQGALAAVMGVAGLVGRSTTNQGQGVIVSGLDAVAAMLAAVLVDAPGIVRQPKSARSPIPQFRHYRCADGEWLYLAALAQPMFFRALEVLDRVEVMVLPGIDGEWLNLMVPGRNTEVVEQLEARFAERPRDEWQELLVAADVPCAPVNSREEWLASETVVESGFYLTRQHAELGSVRLPAAPVSMSAADTSVRTLPDSAQRVVPGSYWREVERPAAGTAHVPAGLPLVGVKVLDLSSFVAGTFGPTILASLGAEVVKVEGADGDPYRDFSVAFAAYNQSKLGLCLDLKHPDGHAAFLELAKQADVVIDGVRPSVRKRLGTDFETLRSVNPRLVRCSVSGWGETGTLAETPAFDPLVQARSGLMAAQGGPDDPVFVSMLVHDVGTATLSALGIVAALYQRQRSGAGQEVQVSLAGSSMLFQSGEMVDFTGRRPPLVGGRDWPGPSAVEQLYGCADGWLLLAAKGFDERDVLNALNSDASTLTGALEGRSVGEALDLLAVAQIPAASVLPRLGPYTDTWLAENGFFHSIEQAGIGQCTVVAGWCSWRGAKLALDAPAPAKGEHTRAVLEAWGVADDQVDALLAAGVAL